MAYEVKMPTSAFVMCVECKGVSDISQLSYDITWDNLSVMVSSLFIY